GLLLPQTWTVDVRPLPDDVEPSEATARRKRLVHNIGNLAVLTGKLNSEQSNHPWSKKRPILLKHSVSVLNNALPPEWSDSSMQARSMELGELAKRAWPRPATSHDDEWRGGQPAVPTASEEEEEEDSRGATYQRLLRWG